MHFLNKFTFFLEKLKLANVVGHPTRGKDMTDLYTWTPSQCIKCNFLPSDLLT